MIQKIKSLLEFNSILQQEKRLIVVDFTAAWCGPCKQISPSVDQWALEYTHIFFCKVDVDENSETSAHCGVSSMPTFQFYKNSQKIAQVVGADRKAILDLLKEHGGAPAPDTTFNGFVDLTPLVMVKQIDCLNQKDKFNASNLFIKTSYLESDADEQLIISIPFNQAVKLHSIKFIANDVQSCPNQVKTWINQHHTPSFSDVDSGNEVELLQVVPNDVTLLKFVRYQSVHQLTLFIMNNHGDTETSKIDQIIIYGTPVETTNMDNWNAGNKE